MQLLTMDLDTFSQASLLGFAALTAYILTLLPTNLRMVFPAHQKNRLSPMAAEISPPHWSAFFLFSCTSRIHLFQTKKL
jgi:hypothetical protein